MQDEFEFSREEWVEILTEWGESVKNLGDITYSYRGGRRRLPLEISSSGNWVIEGKGRGRYAFKKLSRSIYIRFPSDLRAISILEATPEIVLKYGTGDEQNLLTVVRYNRLVDTFLGITAYHLQGHVRAFIQDSGQVEIDDLYLGVDTEGKQYVIPVEAKTAKEPLGVVQVASLNAFSRQLFPDLILQPIVIKSGNDGSIFFALFSDTLDCDKIEVLDYKRYKLVRHQETSMQASARETND